MSSSKPQATDSPAEGDAPPVLSTVDGALGHLTLNRPRQINALSIPLIQQFSAQLDAWAGDDAVQAVLVDGAGERGLCAGGDIKALYAGIVSGEGPGSFFSDEYAMNAAIAHYPKPYVAIMDGITMGGGIGIAGHGSVRVVTETSQLAMPETAIGLFPDVGALYLLARAPGEIGTHMALSGARLGAAAAIEAGLADHFLTRRRVPELVARLARDGRSALDGVEWDFERDFEWDEAPADTGFAAGAREWIDACYRGDDVDEMLARLDARPEDAARQAAATIRAMSPTSVKVTLRALRNAASMTVDEVLAQDLSLVHRFLTVPDLREGIRAQVIDKDRNPRWDPASLDEVSDADVSRFFD